MREKINRINELARKARTEELTDEEKWEQQVLRKEYAASFRHNLEAVLEQTYIMDEDGTKTKLRRKETDDEEPRTH